MFQGRPVIAVTPLYDPERQAAWVYHNYLDSLEEQGAIPLVPPFSQDPAVLDYFLEGCDGLLLTGGCDIDPGLYGQPPAGSQEVCPLRDRLDSALLAGMLERDRPVLGICRGFQLLNILLGGDLWQDLPTQRPSAVLHQMGLPYNRAAHRVDLEPGSHLARLLGREQLPVNSCHHQGVRRLGAGIAPMAWAEDGLPEAGWLPGKRWVWGVQWHPERTRQELPGSRELFAAFVAAAGE